MLNELLQLKKDIYLQKKGSKLRLVTAWKVSKYGIIPGPYFSVFGVNMEIYEINLRIQSE